MSNVWNGAEMLCSTDRCCPRVVCLQLQACLKHCACRSTFWLRHWHFAAFLPLLSFGRPFAVGKCGIAGQHSYDIVVVCRMKDVLEGFIETVERSLDAFRIGERSVLDLDSDVNLVPARERC